MQEAINDGSVKMAVHKGISLYFFPRVKFGSTASSTREEEAAQEKNCKTGAIDVMRLGFQSSGFALVTNGTSSGSSLVLRDAQCVTTIKIYNVLSQTSSRRGVKASTCTCSYLEQLNIVMFIMHCQHCLSSMLCV